ncbi:MAG: hypothetical protein ACOYL8_01270 [Patescibacteria group bacterium]
MEQSISIILAILLLVFIFSPGKNTSKHLKGIKLPSWAKRLKSSDRWTISGREIFARLRLVKWFLLAILKLALISLSLTIALLKVSLSAAINLMPGVKKVAKP